jgi:hypothetical protein
MDTASVTVDRPSTDKPTVINCIDALVYIDCPKTSQANDVQVFTSLEELKEYQEQNKGQPLKVRVIHSGKLEHEELLYLKKTCLHYSVEAYHSGARKRLAESDWKVIRELERLLLSDTELSQEREALRKAIVY